MQHLQELVKEHTTHRPRKGGRSSTRISWTAIAAALGRSYTDCKYKWNGSIIAEKSAKLKKGRFSKEEIAFIKSFKQAWEDAGKGLGLWSALEKELGRGSINIRKRWDKLCGNKQNRRYQLKVRERKKMRKIEEGEEQQPQQENEKEE